MLVIITMPCQGAVICFKTDSEALTCYLVNLLVVVDKEKDDKVENERKNLFNGGE